MAEIVYSRNAIKALRRIPEQRKDQIRRKIRALASGERVDVERLESRPGYRLRVGRYRLVFVRDGDTIEILDVDVRGSIY